MLGLFAFPQPDGGVEVVDLAEFAAMCARVKELFAQGRPVTPAHMRAVRDHFAAEQQPRQPAPGPGPQVAARAWRPPQSPRLSSRRGAGG